MQTEVSTAALHIVGGEDISSREPSYSFWPANLWSIAGQRFASSYICPSVSRSTCLLAPTAGVSHNHARPALLWLYNLFTAAVGGSKGPVACVAQTNQLKSPTHNHPP